MTRTKRPASSPQPLSPSRAWRSAAALLLSLLLAPTLTFADETTPHGAPATVAATPSEHAAPVAAPTAAAPVQAENATSSEAPDADALPAEDNSLGMAH